MENFIICAVFHPTICIRKLNFVVIILNSLKLKILAFLRAKRFLGTPKMLKND